MVPISDGQPVAAATTNPVYLDKTQDDTMLGRLALMNALAVSGPTMSNPQREINSIESYVGIPAGSVYNVLPTWVSTDAGTPTDKVQPRVEALTAKFNLATGHSHDGTSGNGKPVVTSIHSDSNPGIVGAAAILAGANITIVQVGQNITIATAGAGGGGSLQWVENALAPTPIVDNNDRIYAFQSALSQLLYALVKVPSTYVVGNPIKLRTDFYSPDAAGNVLIQSVATLIRQGTDAMTSVANQRTSTNLAVTLSGGTVNIPQSLTLDLTDLTGHINGVVVNPGDYIRIALTRAVDTAVSDVNVPVYGAEVTVS